MKSLQRTLFDFDSVKNFSINPNPKKCFWKKNGAKGLAFDTIHGWCFVYELNAKNRFGAYTGIQQNSWQVYTGGTVANFMSFDDGFAE